MCAKLQSNGVTISGMPGLATNAASAKLPFPRLGISDLLVLTLTTAFGMAWTSGLGDGDPPPDVSNWAATVSAAALDAFNGTLVGVELFGFAVLVREITRGRPLRTLSPAHWWFLVAGPQHVLEGVQYLVAIWGLYQFDYIGQWRTVESAANVPLYLAFVAAWLWAAAHNRARIWRAFYAFKALEQSVWVLFYVYRSARNAGLTWVSAVPSMHFFGVMGTLFVCLVTALLLAVARDQQQRIKRDWLHYVGVAVIVAESFNFFHGYGQLAVRWWSAFWLHFIG